MADGHKFSEEFLLRCESRGAIDDGFLQQLRDLTTEQRSDLARVLIERKVRRAGKNGDPAV